MSRTRLNTEPEEIPDLDHELVIERACAIDVAKTSDKVCVRLPAKPDASGLARRVSWVWDVEATTESVSDLA